jgi:outer membrane receptor protein involved in Fe transport
MNKSMFRFTSAALAVAASLAANPVWAQDTAATEDDDRVILVTAEKRTQALTEVPQSISVVSGDTLEEQHASTFSDYLKLIPGLQLDQSRQGQGRLIIRGVNTDGVASTVGVYMDETPFGSSSGLVNAAVLAGDFDVFDLDRIEVLRGPQGTFYGASSLSGVLKFVTNGPSTEAVELRGRVGVETTDGGDEGYLGNLMVNVPLSGKAAFRASGSYHKYGGFIDSVGIGGSDLEKNINDAESYSGRASLLLMPTETIDIRLTAVAQDIRADAPSLIEANANTLQILHGGLTQAQFVPSFSNLKYRVYNGTVTADLGFADLTSSTSYATQRQRLQIDYTNALSPLIQGIFKVPNEFFQGQRTENEKFTQEVRLSGESSDFDWLVGAYYTDEEGLIQQDFNAVTPGTTTPIAGLPLLGLATIDSDYEEIAAFANATVHLGERFEIGLGGRYSENNQSAHQVTDGILAGGFNDLPVFKSDEDVFTYSVAPRFELSDDVSLHARLAKGFRPGGPNIIPPGAPANIPTTYKSDSVISYEAGLKGQSADGVFYFDLAAFYIDWSNIQLLVTDTASGFNFNGNGSKAKSEGVEFTVTANPILGLDLSLNGAYTNARLTEDTDIGGLDGDRLPFSPKFALSLLADYSFAVSDTAEAHVGGSVRHLSSQSAGFDETYRLANGHQRIVHGYDTVDLSAGVDFGRVSLDAFVRNLTNSTGRTSITGTTVFGAFPIYPGGAIGTGVIRPRTFGVTLGVEL